MEVMWLTTHCKRLKWRQGYIDDKGDKNDEGNISDEGDADDTGNEGNVGDRDNKGDTDDKSDVGDKEDTDDICNEGDTSNTDDTCDTFNIGDTDDTNDIDDKHNECKERKNREIKTERHQELTDALTQQRECEWPLKKTISIDNEPWKCKRGASRDYITDGIDKDN